MKAIAAATIALMAALGAPCAQANPAHDILSGMSEGDRATALAGLLARGGEKCSSASKTFYQGSDKQNNAFWNIACKSAGSWVVQVNNDSQGTTRILSCKVLKAVNGGTCFTKFR